jgi:hypothetical protein
LNLDREKRHQYALAFIKKGQGLEKEIQRRKEGNEEDDEEEAEESEEGEEEQEQEE